MTKFYVITIFPEAFDSYLKTSILGRAQRKRIIKINLVNLRDFAFDKHKTVDDRVYGGGPGMVLKIEPIFKAVSSILKVSHTKFPISKKERKLKFPDTRIILLSSRGKKFNQKLAREFSKFKNLILICGRYEGVDERVAKYIADEEISIGDYILSGGELPALVLIEAISRHLKGVLGKKESLEEIKGSYPVYTRPEIFVVGGKKLKVPQVLVSGNHQKIKEWRFRKQRNI